MSLFFHSTGPIPLELSRANETHYTDKNRFFELGFLVYKTWIFSHSDIWMQLTIALWLACARRVMDAPCEEREMHKSRL